MAEVSPVGWLSLVPPLLTIVLAIVTRRVILSLLAGIVSAVVILLPTLDVYRAAFGAQSTLDGYMLYCVRRLVSAVFEEHLWSSLIENDHIRVFLFTSLLGMQVAMIHASGGMLGVVRWLAPLARSRVGGQALTWFLGLIIFIDDYANCLLLGSTMRPVTDRLKISREKLAFIVDSTAAPVSGIALVSTWVATEISAIAVGYSAAGLSLDSGVFGIFLQTMPSRFYIIFMLFFVVACALLNRDFGPMLTAERRAVNGDPAGKNELSELGQDEEYLPPQPRSINAILPIIVTVGVVLGLLVYTGMQELAGQTLNLQSWQDWARIVGEGDSYFSLVYGSLAGLAVIYTLVAWQRCMMREEVESSLLKGIAHVVPAMAILWLAWTLSKLTGADYLRTGQFVALQVESLNVDVRFLPTVVFLLSSGIAFATGTSWGTIGIVMPMIIPMVANLLAQANGSMPPAVDHPILIYSIASVLAGAIFGDHCSPISDTTILSSRASHCDHVAHVRTQLPYALAVAMISVFSATLPARFGIEVRWLLLSGCIACVLVLLIVGRSVKPTALD